MQQSSATPKNKDVGRGLRKIVTCSQPYLAVLSCLYSFWHGVIPTSYFIFNDFYTCNTYNWRLSFHVLFLRPPKETIIKIIAVLQKCPIRAVKTVEFLDFGVPLSSDV